MYSPNVWFSDPTDSALQRSYLSGLTSASAVLQSMVEEVEEYSTDDTSPQPTAEKEQPLGNGTNVFIIHGHDDGTKEKVARFITKLGLNPVILHEQPNRGQTIIEKFETHAQAAYAIALLTPDDIGGEAGTAPDLKPRARQNVIFELGFFLGKLGRERVCALTKGELESPSDYSGVVYIPIDAAGAWRMTLVRELKAVGIEVDANLAV
jgi:predicted nucleotide-binding protein